MKNTEVIDSGVRGQEATPTVLRNEEAVKKLLDVISSILADEYIQIAKDNKDVFGIASAASQPRNDEGEK